SGQRVGPGLEQRRVDVDAGFRDLNEFAVVRIAASGAGPDTVAAVVCRPVLALAEADLRVGANGEPSTDQPFILVAIGGSTEAATGAGRSGINAICNRGARPGGGPCAFGTVHRPARRWEGFIGEAFFQ